VKQRAQHCQFNAILLVVLYDIKEIPYFPAYKIFSLEILEKNCDECILILVICWKKTGLLHILLQESKPFTSSDARSHDLGANFTVSR
jgi:hypothetical protein